MIEPEIYQNLLKKFKKLKKKYEFYKNHIKENENEINNLNIELKNQKNIQDRKSVV